MKKLFSIYDKKAQAYNPPFEHSTFGEAERYFQVLATKPDSMMQKFPEDFSLHYIGEFDHSSAQVTSCAAQHLCEITKQN